MIDFQAVQLLHRHDPDDPAPMEEVSRRRVAAADEEREWSHGARLFRCTKCNEEVLVGRPAAERQGRPAGS